MSDLGINDELRNILTQMEYNGGNQIKFSELKQKQQVKGFFNPFFISGIRYVYGEVYRYKQKNVCHLTVYLLFRGASR